MCGQGWAVVGSFRSARFRVSANPMAKSIRVYTKTNRAEGPGTMVGVRLQPGELEAVDQWRDNALGQPTRPEAIRRLLKKALQ